MRQDQFDDLQKLSEKLTDIFLEEANSANWPGAGIPDANMDAKTRGDRLWTKKNAIATMGMVQRIVTLTGVVRMNTAAGADGKDAGSVKEHEEEDMDDEMAAATKEAKKMLKDAVAKAKKPAAHGKA